MTGFPDRFGPLDYAHVLFEADDPGELAMEGQWLLWMNGPKELWDVISCEWSEEGETHVVRLACTRPSGETREEEVMLGMVSGELCRVESINRQLDGLISLKLADGSHEIFRGSDRPLRPPLPCPRRGWGGSAKKRRDWDSGGDKEWLP